MVLSPPDSAVEYDGPEPSPRGEAASSAGWGWYAGGVLVGTVLLVVTALRQPYSYDEISQITPYGSDNVLDIISGTRQPPLDPLLGGVFEHLFGVGQLQQRLVPVLAGIGILVVAAVWFRRVGLGRAGAWAVLVLATAPLAVRYGAYTRPYALPLLEMLLFAWATQCWLDERRKKWLVVLAVVAVSLPLTRVPEPMAFLGVAAATFVFLAWRRRLAWSQAGPVAAISIAVFLFLGLPLFFLLGSETQGTFFDPSPTGILGRSGRGLHELATAAVPLLGSSFPWWPTTVAVIVVALVVTRSRRRFLGWPLWAAFLAAPLAFLLAYHLLNPFSFDSLPYRSRAAYFFLPGYVLATAATASLVGSRAGLTRTWRATVAALLGAALLLQLPATATVVVDDAAPDFARVSDVLKSRVPDDAIVLYDRPTPAGQSRQPFVGRPRYLGSTPYVTDLFEVSRKLGSVPSSGPVYVLINGQCARPGRCHVSRRPWVADVRGWRLVTTSERFSLYAPTGGQSGRTGILAALRSFADALGPELGYVETLNAALMIKRQGHPEEAAALVRRLRQQVSPDVRRRIAYWVALKRFPVPD